MARFPIHVLRGDARTSTYLGTTIGDVRPQQFLDVSLYLRFLLCLCNFETVDQRTRSDRGHYPLCIYIYMICIKVVTVDEQMALHVCRAKEPYTYITYVVEC